MDFDALSVLIRRRRAIFPKSFILGELQEETLLAILENANWAPTHKRTEPWRFKVIRGTALDSLGKFLAEAYKASTPEDRFSESKYQKKLADPGRSAAVIAICMQRDPEERIPEWEELASVACAVQNIWLSITALGMGGYWSTPDAMIGRPSILQLAPGEQCLGLFYLGFIETKEMESKRGAIEEKLEWL